MAITPKPVPAAAPISQQSGLPEGTVPLAAGLPEDGAPYVAEPLPAPLAASEGLYQAQPIPTHIPDRTLPPPEDDGRVQLQSIRAPLPPQCKPGECGLEERRWGVRTVWQCDKCNFDTFDSDEAAARAAARDEQHA